MMDLLALAFGSLILTQAPIQKTTLPTVAPGWKVELIAEAPRVLYPTAIVAGPDGTLYVGQDPMDMPGPPTRPIDSIVAIKDGKVRVFAEGLWAVMGLEWVDDVLIVVHAPSVSALRDTDGDGRADQRIDLVTSLGPAVPGASGMNDHVASGVRLGIDGFLYIAVGDKGVPKATGRDGKSITLPGGGVVRVRPDGKDLEVVSTGERNPMALMISPTDDVFTFGNDDDSRKWPNSLTHHIVGGHYGYPFEFVEAPTRCLPILGGWFGGAGAQGLMYNETGLPERYRGSLFVCDWGQQAVIRVELERQGTTYRIQGREAIVKAGGLPALRPVSLAVAPSGDALYLTDWAYDGWLAEGPKTGRVFKLTCPGGTVASVPIDEMEGLDHPALAVRRKSQRALAARGEASQAALKSRLEKDDRGPGRVHALWALDALNSAEARAAIRASLTDPSPEIVAQAARSCGIRKDADARDALIDLLKHTDATVRREAAIALGKLGDPSVGPALYASLGDADVQAAWSVRAAIRRLEAWDEEAILVALADPARRESAFRLVDQACSLPVVRALVMALKDTPAADARARIVEVLAGLYRQVPAWSGTWWGPNPLVGLRPQATEAWDKKAMLLVKTGLSDALADDGASVRRAALSGLKAVGPAAAEVVRGRLPDEADPELRLDLIEAMGSVIDLSGIAPLTAVMNDPKRPIAERRAAILALANQPGPDSLRSRFTLIFDERAPAPLVAAALPGLARSGSLPANDLKTFIDHRDPAIAAAALDGLTSRGPLPASVVEAVVSKLTDPRPEVARAAIGAAARFKLREAVPALIGLKANAEALTALAALADPSAVSIYLAMLDDRDPEKRKEAESALLAIRDRVGKELQAAARSGRLGAGAAASLERVLARYRPVVAWKVIGPFPRSTPRLFFGEPSIDLKREWSGDEDQKVAWNDRTGDATTGRVSLQDLAPKSGPAKGPTAGDELAVFALAEVSSDRDRDALILVGSTGHVVLEVNGAILLNPTIAGGRPYAIDSDRVRVRLHRGANRFLVRSRPGIGAWCFSVQVAEPLEGPIVARRGGGGDEEALAAHAMTNSGDPKRGAALFFNDNGTGCARCHAASGRGTATIGPDLTGIANKYDRLELVRSVLDPSGRVAPGYQAALVARRDGVVLTGLVRGEGPTSFELVDSSARSQVVMKADIEERRVVPRSIMPDGLADGLSPQEFADLIAFLASLR
jgi:putative heme-binding domain-containing protein